MKKTHYPGVNVILQGTEVGTNTDANGRFEFPQKLKQGDVLVFYFIGMDANEYKVGKDTGPIVEIKMMCDYSIMGELMIDSTAMPEPTKLQRVVQKLKAGW
ncbi:MAG: carboxypeptidase-like regulatory domain-containing protein [Chryseolinea sp.]